MTPTEYVEYFEKKTQVSNHDLELMRQTARESAKWADRISLFLGLLTALLLYVMKVLVDRGMWVAVGLAAVLLAITIMMGTKAHSIAGSMGHLSGRAQSLQKS